MCSDIATEDVTTFVDCDASVNDILMLSEGGEGGWEDGRDDDDDVIGTPADADKVRPPPPPPPPVAPVVTVEIVGAEEDVELVAKEEGGAVSRGCFIASRGAPIFTSAGCSWIGVALLPSFAVVEGVAPDVDGADSVVLSFFAALVLLRTFLICLTNSSSCWAARCPAFT